MVSQKVLPGRENWTNFWIQVQNWSFSVIFRPRWTFYGWKEPQNGQKHSYKCVFCISGGKSGHWREKNDNSTIYRAEIGKKWPILALFSQKSPIFPGKNPNLAKISAIGSFFQFIGPTASNDIRIGSIGQVFLR